MQDKETAGEALQRKLPLQAEIAREMLAAYLANAKKREKAKARKKAKDKKEKAAGGVLKKQ